MTESIKNNLKDEDTLSLSQHQWYTWTHMWVHNKKRAHNIVMYLF